MLDNKKSHVPLSLTLINTLRCAVEDDPLVGDDLVLEDEPLVEYDLVLEDEPLVEYDLVLEDDPLFEYIESLVN